MTGRSVGSPSPVTLSASSVNSAAITVVIPAFNRAHTIGETLRSLAGQSFRDFEVIVVDDGSVDGTADVIRSFPDSRVRLVQQENRGVSAARNRGIKEAKGAWVTFLDSDDVADPVWLASTVELTVTHPELGAVFCGLTIDDTVSKTGSPRLRMPSQQGVGPAQDPGTYTPGSYAVRATTLLELGGFDEGLAYSENTDLIWRLVDLLRERGLPTGAIRESLIHYRPAHHRVRLASQKRWLQIVHAVETLMDRHEERFARSPHLRRDYRAVAGVNCARLGDLRRARRYFWANVRESPRSLKAWGRLCMAVLPGGARVWAP